MRTSIGGTTRNFGFPRNSSRSAWWSAYSLAVFADPEPFDVYFIDGRFRTPAACAAVLHGGPGGGDIIIHDYDRTGMRLGYMAIEAVAMRLATANSMARFRRRSNATDADIWALWRKTWMGDGAFPYFFNKAKGWHFSAPGTDPGAWDCCSTPRREIQVPA